MSGCGFYNGKPRERIILVPGIGQFNNRREKRSTECYLPREGRFSKLRESSQRPEGARGGVPE